MADASTAVKDVYLPRKAAIVGKRPLTSMEMLFEVRCDAPLGHMPGQFVEVTVPGVGEAPISVSSSPGRKDAFELVVRKAGRVTAALHERAAGENLGIRGPFGTHFPVDGAMKGRDVVFAAGGIGLVPLRSAIQYVLGHRDDYGKVTILCGTKTPAERLFTDEMAEWAKAPDVTVMQTVDRAEPNWAGNVGVITTLVPQARIDPARTVVVACGPPVMYKFVIVSLYACGVRNEDIYVSLERRMKCGVGKCGHCQVNGLYACMDGPVFRYSDIVNVQEAM